MSHDKKNVRYAGRFYVAYRLSRLGWEVTQPAEKAKGFNLVANRGGRTITVRVRACSERDAAKMGREVDDVVADFVVICQNVCGETPKCYVLTNTEARRIADCNGEGKNRTCWLQMRDYETDDFLEKWDKIA